MFYYLLYPLADKIQFFNLFKYITVRASCAFVFSFIFVLVFWRLAIKHLNKMQIVEKIDMYGHVHLQKLHSAKQGTPTMGGCLIVMAVICAVFLFAKFNVSYIWMIIFLMFSLAGLGFGDDIFKARTGKGLSRTQKLIGQLIIGFLAGVWMVCDKNISTFCSVPFFKPVFIDFGVFYSLWVMFVVCAMSNAVNFTDGLDGLAIGVMIINFLLFAFFAYVAGHRLFADYLFVPYIYNAGELTVLCMAVVGAGLGFLWFNSYPAQVFMGDVGALALGGVLGIVALLIKKEFLLVISGAVFVFEALSVVLQIGSVKLFGQDRKIFKAAPFHHHLQLLGWKEPKIIVRLWIVTIICAVIALITLKLR
ncbi:MAG: phospho-N-acetylmuramoyl-pentapeptide-transferase [Candidatus Omnitrophica bacterium]|nr:phospho-N-acetylmuramoyl-pentapeptide-transferase [Candidatus Omnitrophota bacterium]